MSCHAIYASGGVRASVVDYPFIGPPMLGGAMIDRFARLCRTADPRIIRFCSSSLAVSKGSSSSFPNLIREEVVGGGSDLSSPF